MDHVKGIITKCEYQEKYDRDGIPYKDYVFKVDNQKYTSQVKEKIYLEEGMRVLLNIKPGSQNEVTSGYCIKEGYTWGQLGKALKNEVSRFEKYGFMEGTIVEKQRSTSGSILLSFATFRATSSAKTFLLSKISG